MKAITSGNLNATFRRAIERTQRSLKVNTVVKSELKAAVHDSIRVAVFETLGMGPRDKGYDYVFLTLAKLIRAEAVVTQFLPDDLKKAPCKKH